jgi:hypothetical protein
MESGQYRAFLIMFTRTKFLELNQGCWVTRNLGASRALNRAVVPGSRLATRGPDRGRRLLTADYPGGPTSTLRTTARPP